MGFSKYIPRGVKRLLSSRDGSTALELGFLLPLIAGMVVPLIDLGMGAYTEMQLQSAVQAGAGNALAVGFNAANIASVVQTNGASLTNLVIGPAASPALGPIEQCGCATTTDAIVFSSTQSPPTCTPPCPSGGTGNIGIYVTVAATADYHPLFNYPLISNPLTLKAQAVVRIQ